MSRAGDRPPALKLPPWTWSLHRCGLCCAVPAEAIHLEMADLVVDEAGCTGCRK